MDATAYTVDVKRVNGRRLVDSFVARDQYASVGGASAAPTRRAAPAAPQEEGHSMVWLTVPLALFLVPVLVLTSVAVVRWRRNRLAEQRYRAAG